MNIFIIKRIITFPLYLFFYTMYKYNETKWNRGIYNRINSNGYYGEYKTYNKNMNYWMIKIEWLDKATK